jgi:hypothetical protein
MVTHDRRHTIFSVHVVVFVVFNTVLFVIDVLDGSGNAWFHWVLLSWGPLLALHALLVPVRDGLLGPRWVQRRATRIAQQQSIAGRPPDRVMDDARGRARQWRGVHLHLAAFVIASLFALGMELADGSGGTSWFQWVVAGWGVLVLAHLVVIAGIFRLLNGVWMHRQTTRLLKEENYAAYSAARLRVRRVKGLIGHVVFYVVSLLGGFLIEALAEGGQYDAEVIDMGLIWGVILVVHGMLAVGPLLLPGDGQVTPRAH